jgi:hypothetical protein
MINKTQQNLNEASLIESITILTKRLTKEKRKNKVMRDALVRITGISASPNPSIGQVSFESNGALMTEDRIEKTGKI